MGEILSPVSGWSEEEVAASKEKHLVGDVGSHKEKKRRRRATVDKLETKEEPEKQVLPECEEDIDDLTKLQVNSFSAHVA